MRFAKVFTLYCLILLSLSAKTPSNIYFTSDKSGNWDIYSYNTNNDCIVQLTSTPFDDKDIFFSPESNQLVFVSGDGYIKTMNLSSNLIIDSFSVDSNFTYAVQPSMKDEQIYFSFLYDRKKDVSSICSYSYSNNKIIPIVSMPSSLFFPVPVRGMDMLAYTYHMCSYNCNTFITEIWSLDKKTGINQQKTMFNSHIIDLAPGKENEIVFSSDADGDMDIYKLNLLTGNISQITDTPGESISPSVSNERSNKIIFIERTSKETKLVIYDPVSEKTSELIPLPNSDYMEVVW